jgi:hypothetical protein
MWITNNDTLLEATPQDHPSGDLQVTELFHLDRTRPISSGDPEQDTTAPMPQINQALEDRTTLFAV